GRTHLAFRPDYAAPQAHSARRPGRRLLAGVAQRAPPRTLARSPPPHRSHHSTDGATDRARSRFSDARNPSRAAFERRELNFDQFQASMENAAAGIRKVIIGQDDAIRYSLVVVLCNQHAL